MSWKRDRRGSTTVQSLFFIIIFIAILALAVEIWQVISVKQSLHSATYQAAKYIALHGMEWQPKGCVDCRLDPGVWRARIWPFIVAELKNNSFVPQETIEQNLGLRIWLNPEATTLTYCKKGQFQVWVDFNYVVYIPPRFGQAEGVALTLPLGQSITGELQCYPPGPG